MNAEPISLVLCGSSLLAEPQMQHVERAWPQAHGANPSVLLGYDHPCLLKDAEVLHE